MIERVQIQIGEEVFSTGFSYVTSKAGFLCYWGEEVVAIVKEDPPFWVVLPSPNLNPNWTKVVHTKEAALLFAACIAEDSEFGSWH